MLDLRIEGFRRVAPRPGDHRPHPFVVGAVEVVEVDGVDADANGGGFRHPRVASGPPGDELVDVEVAGLRQHVPVAVDCFFADFDELVGRKVRLDSCVLQRTVEPVDVLLHAEALPVERALDLVDGVTDEEAPIEGIDP